MAYPWQASLCEAQEALFFFWFGLLTLFFFGLKSHMGKAENGVGMQPMPIRNARFREYVSAPGKVFPRFGVAPRVGVKDSHSLVWPLEWSVTHKRGIL